jgi:hypothetical protein
VFKGDCESNARPFETTRLSRCRVSRQESLTAVQQCERHTAGMWSFPCLFRFWVRATQQSGSQMIFFIPSIEARTLGVREIPDTASAMYTLKLTLQTTTSDHRNSSQKNASVSSRYALPSRLPCTAAFCHCKLRISEVNFSFNSWRLEATVPPPVTHFPSLCGILRRTR